MLLRPRQKLFVERCVHALGVHRNTLGVAPTGAGKTLCLSAVIGEILGKGDAKACVLAHRDELTAQNRSKFHRVTSDITSSVVDAGEKSWRGQVTFAMVPTLARAANLDAMPKLDLLVIDEAHHAAADSYRRIIDRARHNNPDCALFGVTATPNRGDGKGLRPVFSNVADQIGIGELIRSGHLVPPRTFVIDVGVREELNRVQKIGDDYDMAAVSKVMNTRPVTDAVIDHWKEKANGRPTVVFCSTILHASGVAEAFCAAGVPTTMVSGDMPDGQREQALADYASGKARVMVNVAVLTEGWDHPPTSCVILLRPSSYKSTMIQMVGRGLRTVNPEEYPGVIKTDCIVLDFGISSLLHGSLEQDITLDGLETSGIAPTKDCPQCGGVVPLGLRICPFCGYGFNADSMDGPAPLEDFVMSEVDLLKRSSFIWCDLFGDDGALLASGFNAWGGIFFLNGRWYGIGGLQRQRPRLLAIGERTVCMAAADDWLNDNETDETAHKSRRWLHQAPTSRQLALLPPPHRDSFSLTRYQASALLVFQFNRSAIRSLVFEADADARRP